MHSNMLYNETMEKIDHNHDNHSRRSFLTASVEGMALLFLSADPKSSSALSDGEHFDEKQHKQDDRLVLKGKIILQSGSSIPDDISLSALYVTARPNNSIDVPRAILDGSNGKPPPVLAARFPIPNPNQIYKFQFQIPILNFNSKFRF